MEVGEIGWNYRLPGLKFFGTQWMCYIFDGVTQTMSVIVGGIYAPEKKTNNNHDENEQQADWPFWACTMMRYHFDSISNRIHFAITQGDFHTQGCTTLVNLKMSGGSE